MSRYRSASSRHRLNTNLGQLFVTDNRCSDKLVGAPVHSECGIMMWIADTLARAPLIFTFRERTCRHMCTSHRQHGGSRAGALHTPSLRGPFKPVCSWHKETICLPLTCTKSNRLFLVLTFRYQFSGRKSSSNELMKYFFFINYLLIFLYLQSPITRINIKGFKSIAGHQFLNLPSLCRVNAALLFIWSAARRGLLIFISKKISFTLRNSLILTLDLINLISL